MRPGLLAAGVAVVAVALAAAATAVQQPAATTAEAGLRVPVVETTVACPGLRSRTGYTVSSVAAATPPDLAPAGAGGGATVATLTRSPADSRVVIRLSRPGDEGTYIGTAGERDSLVGSARGGLAPGFAVVQTERTVDGGGRGLASTACLPTGTDFWFVGAATGVGQRPSLVLTNPETAPAIVDLALLGPHGAVDAASGRGLVVPARGRREVDVQALAPGVRVLALHVVATSGRLSAAVTETDVSGSQPRGTDWIPASQPPATAQVLPGLPAIVKGRAGRIRLNLAAPGGQDAVVSVRVVAEDGTFALRGLTQLDVPAGGVASYDVTAALRGRPGTLLLSSDVPVVAGARAFLWRRGGYGDLLFAATGQPLTDSAVVPDNKSTRRLVTRVFLSAPQAAATVQLSTFTPGRRTTTATVRVAAGTTRAVTVHPAQGAGQFALVVTPQPGSGPVYAARLLDEQGTRGPLVTELPLVAARVTVVRPVARPDVRAGQRSP